MVVGIVSTGIRKTLCRRQGRRCRGVAVNDWLPASGCRYKLLIGTFESDIPYRQLSAIIDLDSQVSDSAFKLRMTKQELDSSQVPRPAIDQRCLGSPERVSTVHGWVKANGCHPRFYYSSVLPGG